MGQQTLIPGTEPPERKRSYWDWLNDVFNDTANRMGGTEEACNAVTKAMISTLPGLKQMYFKFQMPYKTAVTLILAKLGRYD